MDLRRWLVLGVSTCTYGMLVGVLTTVASAATAQKAMNYEAVVQGAIREGKVTWSTHLEEQEVSELNKAFHAEFPRIKVNYKRVRAGEQRQRVLTEMQAGLFPYDLMSIESEAVDDFQKLKFLIDPIDWHGMFGMDERMVHPKKFLVSVGNNPAGIYYNKSLVPKEHVPKTWADCYNPYFKGRFSVDVRPVQMLTVMAGYGEKWTMDFARNLLANKPKWMRGNTLAVTMVGAGEVLLSCPASHAPWYRAAEGKPKYPVGFVFPEGPIVAERDLFLSPLNGAANPNASILLAGWIARKGVKYLRTGRESIFHPETELGAEIKKMKREVKVATWDMAISSEELMRKILEIWGFPKSERSGG